MKKIIAVASLTLASTLASAAWEDVWKNPDLDPKFGEGYEFQFSPVTSRSDRMTSIDRFYQGNADGYAGYRTEPDIANVSMPSSLADNSLDVFTRGNADQYDGFQDYDSMLSESRTYIRGIGDDTRSF